MYRQARSGRKDKIIKDLILTFMFMYTRDIISVNERSSPVISFIIISMIMHRKIGIVTNPMINRGRDNIMPNEHISTLKRSAG